MFVHCKFIHGPMKKIFITLLASAFSLAVFAQQSTIEYWPNGNKKSEGVLQNAQPVSANDSKAVKAQKLANAAKDGKWSYWYENGQLSAEETYSNGTPMGIWKTYYTSGKPSSEINFTTGTAHYWFENGQEQSNGIIGPDMQPDGKWTGWYDNGKVNFEGEYDHGKKTGTWVFYDNKGVKTTEQKFENGNVVDTKKF